MVEGDERLLKLAYDFTESPVDADEHVSLGVVIPDDYLVTHSYVYVDTDVVSANANTVGLSCENTSDLLAPNDFSDDAEHALVDGAVWANPTTWVRTAGGCTPTMQIGTGASGITAGRLIFNLKLHKVEPPFDVVRKIDLEP